MLSSARLPDFSEFNAMLACYSQPKSIDINSMGFALSVIALRVQTMNVKMLYVVVMLAITDGSHPTDGQIT